MKIGFFSDVHGNQVALETCLQILDRMYIDELYCLGDVVGYIPGEVACLSMLLESRVICQKGNHEAMLLNPTELPAAKDEVYGLRRARNRLKASELDAIELWPIARTLKIDGRRILAVHGSPNDPLYGYVYQDSVLSEVANRNYDVIIMGQTHRPFIARVGDVLLINVGSVGLPRDVGNLSAFAVYDTTSNRAVIYRVPFDASEVMRRWGSQMHGATVACLERRTHNFVGEVVR